MKILLVGANGQLGSDMVTTLAGEDLIPLTHQDVDICEPIGMRATLRHHRPEIVINTAAYHKVEECETNAAQAFAVNTLGVRNLALACREQDCVLVHLSTDYVFDGHKGSAYVESDLPNPINASLAMGNRCPCPSVPSCSACSRISPARCSRPARTCSLAW